MDPGAGVFHSGFLQQLLETVAHDLCMSVCLPLSVLHVSLVQECQHVKRPRK